MAKEHGFLFKSDMVRALLRKVDPKTHTRRPITFHNSISIPNVTRKEWPELKWDEAWLDEKGPSPAGNPGPYWHVPFRNIIVRVYPRVQPQDILWVRETWLEDPPSDGTWSYIEYMDCKDSKLNDIPKRFRNSKYCIYKASWTGDHKLKWRSSLLMPRWASRIDLLINEMGSQRIQDICPMDIISEGIKRSNADTFPLRIIQEKHAFMELWDTINQERGYGWETNYPVWIHIFKRIKPK